MRHIPLLSIAALTLFCILAPAAHAAPPKPCDLLSHPAAEALFGAPLKSTLEAGTLACIYSNSETSAINIHFQAIPDGAPPTYGPTIMKAILHKDYDADAVDSVPGLGDQNFFITSKQPKSTFTVLYHKTIVTLIVTGAKNPNLRAAMIQTMKQALTKF